MKTNREGQPSSLFGGRCNPELSSMDRALFDADIDRRPYTFLGAYFRCLANERSRDERP